MDTTSVAQRMSWAANRVTTRVEDMAYCLLGIFDVNMPLLYGEGPKAFQRLQEEIMKVSADQSLLAWGLDCSSSCLGGISTALVQSLSDFAGCGDLLFKGPMLSGDLFSMTQKGLFLNLPVIVNPHDKGLIYYVLNCITSKRESLDGNRPRVLAVPMLHPGTTSAGRPCFHQDEYCQLSLRVPTWVDKQELVNLPRRKVYLLRLFRHGDTTRAIFHFEMAFEAPQRDYFIGGVFPPELSNKQRVRTILLYPDPYGDVLVHFASCSRFAPDFAVCINFGFCDRQSGPMETTVNMDRECLKASALPRTLTYPGMRKMVLDIIAKEMHGKPHELFQTQELAEFGFTMNLQIARCLYEELGVDITSSDLFDRPITVGDVLKKLRFITRPGFHLSCDDSRKDNVRGTAIVTRVWPTKVRL